MKLISKLIKAWNLPMNAVVVDSKFEGSTIRARYDWNDVDIYIDAFYTKSTSKRFFGLGRPRFNLSRVVVVDALTNNTLADFVTKNVSKNRCNNIDMHYTFGDGAVKFGRHLSLFELIKKYDLEEK